MKKIFTLFLFFISLPLFCFDIAGSHRGKITALIHNTDTVISAGEDGFIVIWSVSRREAVERFQLTKNGIKSMVKHPLKDEICVIESSDIGDDKISAWNYKTKEKLFSVGEKADFVNYSAGGTYVIIADLNDSRIILRDSSNGHALSDMDIPPGKVTFGITGKTEQNILLYQGENEDFEGQILYLDMESFSVTGRFNAPANLSNIIIFGNNLWLAGINSSGLLITDAASGMALDSVPNIEKSALLYPINDGFFCFSHEKNILYRFTVDRRGIIVKRQNLFIVPNNEETISAFAVNVTAVFADEGGNLFMAGLTSESQGKLFKMAHNFQTRIIEIAANDKSIAFLTEDGGLGFLPHDFKFINDNYKFFLKKTSGFTRMTAIASLSSKENQREPYILWQGDNAQIIPKIVYSDLTDDEIPLNFMIERKPLRSISSKNGNILVLDSAGRLSIYNFNNFKAGFTSSYVGAVESAFVDENYLLLCRSAINGNSPFLFVNYRTGETIPVTLEAQAGIFAYTGNSGRIYAASVTRQWLGVKTKISELSINKPAYNVTLYVYGGEASNLSIAEVNGVSAITGGSEGATIYHMIDFERTQGLSVKLLGLKDFFLSLDSEGNISWHNTDGKLLAVFRINKDKWVLETDGKTFGGTLE
ncbi:MAG: hypothetical protein LBV17_03795 [Treponema sp.]|jgi:hypothetical protein|nr:hypothetical protein [Treponema sp.]